MQVNFAEYLSTISFKKHYLYFDASKKAYNIKHAHGPKTTSFGSYKVEHFDMYVYGVFHKEKLFHEGVYPLGGLRKMVIALNKCRYEANKN